MHPKEEFFTGRKMLFCEDGSKYPHLNAAQGKMVPSRFSPSDESSTEDHQADIKK
jgi:hypothetical protein